MIMLFLKAHYFSLFWKLGGPETPWPPMSATSQDLSQTWLQKIDVPFNPFVAVAVILYQRQYDR